MTELPSGQTFAGEVPDKKTQDKNTFASNVHGYLKYIVGTHMPFIQNWSAALKTLTEEITTIANAVKENKDAVVEKEALVNPHYNNIDTVSTNIEDIKNIALNITAIKTAQENAQTAVSAKEEALEAKEIVINASSTLAEGTINDAVTSTTNTFSSKKIEEKLAENEQVLDEKLAEADTKIASISNKPTQAQILAYS